MHNCRCHSKAISWTSYQIFAGRLQPNNSAGFSKQIAALKESTSQTLWRKLFLPNVTPAYHRLRAEPLLHFFLPDDSNSFSAGPLRLRAWIWPLIKLMLDIGYVWQISLRRTLRGFEHRFGYDLGTRLKCQHSWVYLIIQLLSAFKAISHYHPKIIFRRATSWCYSTLVVKSYKAVPILNKQQVFLQQGHYFGMLWG